MPRHLLWKVVVALIMMGIIGTSGWYLITPSYFQDKLTQFSYLFSNKPHPGSCLILEEKYCKTVTFLPYNLYAPGYKGDKIAVYNLPPGAILFAPASGDLSPVTANYQDPVSRKITSQGGFILTESNASPRTQEIDHIFMLLFDKAPFISLKIRKGSVIGKITSNKSIPYSGNYNLVVILSRQIAYLVYGQHGNHNTPTQPIIEDDSKELLQILRSK